MSIWPRSRGANTRRIAPTRATLPTTAFRLAGIVPSMRCGLMRPHLKRWRRSRITSPSTRTVPTGSANRRRRQEGEMRQARESKKKALFLGAFDTLFNKRDYAAPERFWSSNYIQHSAHIEPGREGLFNLIKGSPPSLKYEPGVIVADADFVIVHGRFSGTGRPRNWIAADVVRIADGVLAEHWDVLQDEAARAESKSGLPMFGDSFAD